MADGGHYRGKGGTRQGIYIVTPSGELLASANVLNPAGAIELMDRGLIAWEKAPTSTRKLDPRARGDGITRWEDSFPDNGLTLRITLRELPKNGAHSADRTPPANRDHAWFSRTEARNFLPLTLKVGQRQFLSKPVFQRLACLHLVDAVHGQGLPFAPEEIRYGRLECEVVELSGSDVRVTFRGEVTMKAEGPWLLGENDWTPDREYPRSIDLNLVGEATYSTDSRQFTDFELVATGLRRGRSQFNGRSGPDDEGSIGFVLSPVPAGPSSRVPPAFIDIYRDFGADWVQDL